MYSITKESIKKGEKNGFTLIEILVAVVLSGIIIVGLMETFDSLANTKAFLESKNQKIERLEKIALLIQSDIRCKIGNFSATNEGFIKKLSFVSTHSLFFNGSIPVKIDYYMKKNINGKNILYREESDEATGIDFTIPLTYAFSKFDYKFYLNGRWQDNPSTTVKISLVLNSKKYEITQRGMIE